MNTHIDIVIANFNNDKDARALVYLMDTYAKDPMGGGEPLTERVKHALPNALMEIPNAFSVIAYVDGHPAGLINCFEAFSTFKCQPLINIHDVIVSVSYRGLGLSSKMLKKVEEVAKERACCKVTLEVLEGNTVAKAAYEKAGFTHYQLDPKMGRAMFWEKYL